MLMHACLKYFYVLVEAKNSLYAVLLVSLKDLNPLNIKDYTEKSTTLFSMSFQTYCNLRVFAQVEAPGTHLMKM